MFEFILKKNLYFIFQVYQITLLEFGTILKMCFSWCWHNGMMKYMYYIPLIAQQIFKRFFFQMMKNSDELFERYFF